MSTIPTAADIEKMAQAKGLTIIEMCRRASIDPATFHRWKIDKSSPSLKTVKRWLDVVKPEKE